MSTYLMHSHMEYLDDKDHWHLVENYICPVETDEQLIDEKDWPFWWQSYDMFAVIADVRNYSNVKSIEYNCGLPKDSEYLNEKVPNLHPQGWGDIARGRAEPFDRGYYCYWFLASSLFTFNYYDKLVDVRDNNTEKTYREFLGENFFTVMESLKKWVERYVNGDATRLRIIVCFD